VAKFQVAENDMTNWNDVHNGIKRRLNL
jgi:hypothetical protein